MTTIYRVCRADGCDQPVDSRGLCGAHYQLWRRMRPVSGGREKPPIPRRDPHWMTDAACAGRDPEDWFPLAAHQAAKAIAVCFGCPVIHDCDKAIRAVPPLDRHGVWAGVWWVDGRVRKVRV